MDDSPEDHIRETKGEQISATENPEDNPQNKSDLLMYSDDEDSQIADGEDLVNGSGGRVFNIFNKRYSGYFVLTEIRSEIM